MKTKGFRQQAGFACENCRRRKARCDRVRPECSLCAEMGVTCVVIEQRPQRGPKKGQLDEMRTRIAELEWQLGKQVNRPKTAESTPADALCGSTTATTIPPLTLDVDDPTNTSHLLSASALQTVTPASSTTTSIIFSTSASNDAVPPTTSATTTMSAFPAVEHDASTDLHALMDWQDMDMDNTVILADMGDVLQNQLYFDRVHDTLPMIHRRRYFSWVDQENPSPARSCLRSAMHTVAAAKSAQYHSLGEALYQETCQLLESQHTRKLSRSGSTSIDNINDPGPSKSCAGQQIPLELVQAWLLLAHYEFLRIDEHQAMLTAGRAFRLVQLARLYDVDESSSSSGIDDMPLNPFDGSDNDEHEENLSYAATEEKRRTFWLAFNFDRFLCSRNEWPLTLQEEAVRTRLPAPEESFQNNQPTQMCFLSEVLAGADNTQADASTSIPLAPFAECVVLAALQGRCMAHRRMSLVSSTGADGAQEFWTRHEQLVLALDKRYQMLTQSAAFTMTNRDPMVIFTYMLAQKVIINLDSILETVPWQRLPQQKTADRQLLATSYKWRAERAAVDMVRLARSVRSIGCFALHPFMADPLACAADFLIRHTKSINNTKSLGNVGGNPSCLGSNDKEVECLLFLLRSLRYVNILAQDYLSTLEFEYNSIRMYNKLWQMK
ncbi:fungal-specific transcription factor domain-containing protein [Trichoderma pleuroticola]